jgi:hypothetical protein
MEDNYVENSRYMRNLKTPFELALGLAHRHNWKGLARGASAERNHRSRHRGSGVWEKGVKSDSHVEVPRS